MSHVNGIDFEGFEFRSVCTGSGPINQTLGSLVLEYNVPMWQLLCLELERYMATESINGGPYRRMENIGKNNSSKSTDFILNTDTGYSFPTDGSTMLKEFFEYMLKTNVLKFNYVKGSYGLATNFADTVLNISNSFIYWFNNRFKERATDIDLEELKNYRILKDVIIADGSIYDISSSSTRDYSQYVGRRVLTFKGKPVNLVISGITDSTRNVSIILHVNIIRKIVSIVLELLNCDYGNSKKANSGVDKEKTRFLL